MTRQTKSRAQQPYMTDSMMDRPNGCALWNRQHLSLSISKLTGQADSPVMHSRNTCRPARAVITTHTNIHNNGIFHPVRRSMPRPARAEPVDKPVREDKRANTPEQGETGSINVRAMQPEN
jgi:hypothetical protein